MRGSRPLALATCVVIGAGVTAADAQNYPVKPIRLVVAASTGGTPDILARIPRLLPDLRSSACMPKS